MSLPPYSIMTEVERNIGIVRRRQIDDEQFEYWINSIVRNEKPPINVGINVIVQSQDGLQKTIQVNMDEVEEDGFYVLINHAVYVMKAMIDDREET